MNFLKRGGILAVGNVLPWFSTFIIVPLLTGSLSTLEYGQYDLILKRKLDLLKEQKKGYLQKMFV